MSEELTADLLDALGEDDFFVLVEAHAGTRLYVPANPDRSDLPQTIGDIAADRLARAYPGGYIKVPLAREFRVLRYVAASMTNRQIARRLGLTETGVERLIKRARETKPAVRPKRKDPRQIEMF